MREVIFKEYKTEERSKRFKSKLRAVTNKRGYYGY
jgi:hypothetical protein